MDYQQTLGYIHSFGMFSAPAGLERIRELCRRLGDPQERLRVVHVAGTNGKGSITATAASVLRSAGYRTGMYISPYVLDFCERIQVDGQMIPRGELCTLIEQVRPHVEEMRAAGRCPTEFEVITAAAFLYFVRERCDVVCLEVGLGGRFDATNVITHPLVAVIASIGLDHIRILGGTVEQIAFEKCGILKPGCPVVCYPKQEVEALGVVLEQCAQKGCTLLQPNAAAVEMTGEDVLGLRFRYDGLEVRLALPGLHQVYNAITAIEALRQLRVQGFAISDADIVQGIAAVRFPARMEVLSRKPLVILDGAHNPDGVQALAQSLKRLEGRRLHLVLGMLRDKDCAHALAPLLPLVQTVCCVPVQNPRALPAEELAGIARSYHRSVEAFEDSAAALETALARARADAQGAVVAAGSLYLAGELRPRLMALLGQGPDRQA